MTYQSENSQPCSCAMWGKRAFARALTLTLAAALLTSLAMAQQGSAKSNDDYEKGFTSYAEFGGSVASGQHVLELNTAAGYNFSRHVGVNFAVPIYFVGGTSTTTAGTSTSYSASGIGAPSLALLLTFKNPGLNYATAFTTYLPAGDTKDGLSTGRTSFDWNNRFEHSFDRVTPFAEVGIANTIVDARYFRRPYAAHGNNAHLQGGLSFDLTDNISIGASAYDIAPWGTQTLYSRTNNGQGNGAQASSNRIFNANSVTTGVSDIAKDDGFSTWVDLSPSPVIDAEVGFTRSLHFAFNTMSFTVRFNWSKMAKQASHQ